MPLNKKLTVLSAMMLGASALLLSGCASGPQYTEEQLAQGVRIKGFHANIMLSPKNSRAQRVARVFGNPLNDVDPEKYLWSATQESAWAGFAHGLVEGGLEGGLLCAAVNTGVSKMTYNRAHYDEWNAILNPANFKTIYEAQAYALDEATTLTTKALEKQGYRVLPRLHQHYNQEGSLGKWFDNTIVLVNDKLGCPMPKNDQDDDTCRVVLRTLYYNAASREAPPLWLSDLKEAFIIRSLGVLPEGEKKDGSAFTLNREAREAIAREATNHFYFVGAFDERHAGFVGEEGQVAYCHLPEAELKKARERDKQGLVEHLSNNVKQNIEKHGWKALLGVKPLFGE